MFCPKCGVSLTAEAGQPLTCDPGAMPLSASLEQRFREYFVDGGPARTAPLPSGVGGDWFCPACGVRMIEPSPGDVRCPSCNRSLAEFIPALVEGHPHRQPDGRWR